MVTGTGALSIEETFLGPQALPPPPTRHALFAILIALAALVHFGTIGIGDLYSETEGQYAAAAREMIQSGQYLLPTNDSIPRLQKPPLLYWLIVASYKVFGINTAATRVPIAFSVVATLAFTFLIGERLADYWRGFAAGLIYLTLSGTFIFGRIVMPEPLFGALFAGAIYCGLAGFQQRHRRRAWFAGFWICAALACLTKGPHGLLFPAATFSWRRAMRPREISFQDALPMTWAIVVLVPVLAIGQRQDYYAMSMFSAFALWAAMIFERVPNSLRNLGATTVALAGIAIGFIAIALSRFLPKNESEWGETDLRWTAWKALVDMPASAWLHFRPLLAIAAIGLLTGAIVTVYLLRRGRETIATVGLAVGMVVVGLCMISGIARIAPFFSLAEASRFLNSRLGTNG